MVSPKSEPDDNPAGESGAYSALMVLAIGLVLAVCVVLGALLAWIIPLALLIVALAWLTYLTWQSSRRGIAYRDVAIGALATALMVGRLAWRALRNPPEIAAPLVPPQAFQDPLTTLPNRALLFDRIELALARTARNRRRIALLFLDLDNFKAINDSFGHTAGDHLLITVAAVLQSLLRASDTAARLGGDEFVILLEDIRDPSDAVHVAERIAEALHVPFVFGDEVISVTTSIGIAFSNTPNDRPTDLLHNADTAMYRAKRNGKNRYEIFDPSMNREAHERMEREHEFRRAVERGEFRLFYQPSVRLDSGLIAGVEALLRWQHPTRGLLTPDQFVPLAEETGLILPLGRWVLAEACRQAREWRFSGGLPMMSVNLSERQFRQASLSDEVASVLDEVGLNPQSLALEVSERVLMSDAEAAIRICRALKNLGVQIIGDDFGTGFSSLRYLKQIPVDYLKIDRSFMSGFGTDPEVTVVVSAMVNLAHSLGIKVLAEGVETAAQASWLRELRCDLAQGFYFAKPSASGLTGLLFSNEINQDFR